MKCVPFIHSITSFKIKVYENIQTKIIENTKLRHNGLPSEGKRNKKRKRQNKDQKKGDKGKGQNE